MEYSYYRESRHHYLVIPCPEVENYQYRMLALNRMETLVSCSVRTIDGRRYLYYDITAKENMTEFFRSHGSAAQEIPRLLYAIADAGAVLERYLLDCRRMMLGAEFVFYDYTRGEFLFLYYPEDEAEQTGPAFYEYLADHADPQDKMLYYTLLRLISISANKTFVLEPEFLERSLGRKRPENESLCDAPAAKARESCGYGQMEMQHTDDSSARDVAGNSRVDVADNPSLHTETAREEESGQEPSAARGGRSYRLLAFAAAAILLLAGAIGLAMLRLYVPMDVFYSRSSLVGMIACLSGSILIAVYGTVCGVRSSRQELHQARDRAVWERQNALTPVDDFH